MTLRKKLEKLVDEIMEMKNEYRSLSVEKKEFENDFKALSLEIKTNIMNETDEKGKPLYSNQAKRDSAFNEVIEKDKNYQKMKNKIENIEDDIQVVSLKIEKLKYDFKIEDILSRIGE